MRSVNLIPKATVRLEDWEAPLAAHFPAVWLDHWDILAQSEGQAPGIVNRLAVEDGREHIFVLDRPTTIREYEPQEIEALRRVVGEPKQFFAVDYTDEGLLLRVVETLLQHEGEGKIVVEDDQGNLAFLEAFLGAGDTT